MMLITGHIFYIFRNTIDDCFDSLDTVYLDINLALDRPTWQSSTRRSKSSERAVDGNRESDVAYCTQTDGNNQVTCRAVTQRGLDK